MKSQFVSLGLCLLALLCGEALQAEEPAVQARQKSVTVYPIVITPAKNIGAELPVRIAELLGAFLERGGMEKIEIAPSAFSPPDTDSISELAAAFGQFVAKEPLKTEYAVFGQFVGTPATGPTEIRTVVADQTGKVIFADLANQEAFSRSKVKPDCPMTCTLFVAGRLGEVWELADPLREDVPEGKMAEIMRKRSGLPSEEELAAMNKRLEAVKGKFATSTVTVYPIHLWQGWDKSSAPQLARMLNEQAICRAKVSEIDPELTVQGDPNEQKVLWDTARSFREFVRNNPPATQYALLADYGLSSSSDGKQLANHVHLILCECTGDWVLVDFQNSHHGDFQNVAPKTVDGCNRLAALRLKSRLSE